MSQLVTGHITCMARAITLDRFTTFGCPDTGDGITITESGFTDITCGGKAMRLRVLACRSSSGRPSFYVGLVSLLAVNDTAAADSAPGNISLLHEQDACAGRNGLTADEAAAYSAA